MVRMDITGILKMFIKFTWELLFMPLMGEFKKLQCKNISTVKISNKFISGLRTLFVFFPYKVAKNNTRIT